MTALAPWESKKDHAAYVKRVRAGTQQNANSETRS